MKAAGIARPSVKGRVIALAIVALGIAALVYAYHRTTA